MNSGSLLSLNLLTMCGLSPPAFHTRWTMRWSSPSSFARLRVLQWVALRGRSCVVFLKISASTRRRTKGLLPSRGASFSIPRRPSFTKRERQRPTLSRVTPSSFAISRFSLLCAASKTILARRIKRAGVFPRAQRPSVAFCSSVSSTQGGNPHFVSFSSSEIETYVESISLDNYGTYD